MQPATIVAGCVLLAFIVVLAMQRLVAGVAAGERWQPDNPDAVIVVLSDSDVASTPLASLRRQLADDPQDAALAAQYAKVALTRYAINGDPRYLGYAEGALLPWADRQQPPSDIWLLRGRLLQTQHRFVSAAQDLERLLQWHPGQPEALTLAADARRRAGDLDAARRHCIGLQLAGRPTLAKLCAADVLLSLGRFEQGFEVAMAALDDAGAALAPESSAWGHAIAGDAAFALQRYTAATRAYTDAMKASSAPPLALRLSAVDVAIESGRLADAWQSLQLLPAADAVLLRRAMVAAELQPEVLPGLRETLDARLGDKEPAGGDELHWREKALYALHVQEDARTAHRYAKRNWQVQKAWEDAMLLLHTSREVADPATARQVEDWRKAQGGVDT